MDAASFYSVSPDYLTRYGLTSRKSLRKKMMAVLVLY